jgi:hypothetical protein
MPTILNNGQPVTTEAQLNAAITSATTGPSGAYEIAQSRIMMPSRRTS